MILITTLLNTLRAIKTVKKQNLSASYKHKILRAYFRYIVFDIFLPKNKYIRLLDYKIKYSVYGGFSFTFNDIFIDNHYWFETSNKNPFIIDAGSNIGLSVLYFKQLYPNAKIMAFEPDPDAFDCLKFNIEQNNITQVELHNKALSDSNTIIKLSYDKDRPGSIRSSTEGSVFESYRDVEAVTLSSYIDHPVDLLKIDIEGAETSVFQDLEKNDKLKYIQNIIMEYHHHIGGNKDCLSIILNIFEANNFSYQLYTDEQKTSDIKDLKLIMIYARRDSE